MKYCSIFVSQTVKDFNIFLKENKIKNIIIGVSGGIDSAVSLAILKELKNIKVYAYFIDIESSKSSLKDAQLVAKHLGFTLEIINLNKTYKVMVNDIKPKTRIQKGNIKSRLRMITLYNMASMKNGIVVGNSNFDELYLGYFTKFGDNAVDYCLLNNLLKSDVIALAKYFNLPQSIINKSPSADLYPSQTDEKELNISYEAIDNYFKNKKITNNEVKLIKTLHQKNKHKLLIYKNKNYLTKHKGLFNEK